MFVFGEVSEPNQETVNLVEDIVRSQIIELVNYPSIPSDTILLTNIAGDSGTSVSSQTQPSLSYGRRPYISHST